MAAHQRTQQNTVQRTHPGTSALAASQVSNAALAAEVAPEADEPSYLDLFGAPVAASFAWADEDACTESRGSKSVLYPAMSADEAAAAGCDAHSNNPELQRQLDWGNENARTYVQALAGRKLDPEGPAVFPELVGTCEYYDARVADFVRRHPGEEPPDYYLNYGQKYCERFSEETFPGLSGAGQEWDVRTRMNLQLAMEMGALGEKEELEKAESTAAMLKTFAFKSHPKAYLDAGLADLPFTDLAMIGLTPDIADLATVDGVDQVQQTARKMVPEVLQDTGAALATAHAPPITDVAMAPSPVAAELQGASLEQAADVGVRLAKSKVAEVAEAGAALAGTPATLRTPAHPRLAPVRP